ncbi:ATP-binding protein [Octadecabacter sp. CECT 8868]|uniref:sensor histidine kinase n=1 Tax=Octadecabacter algicola TaxID=2909342 RepID=UPI001F20C7F0|nr:ATP-binding protein [Octadecabacter algicola]MCF2903964.1 ATP-binding protein [Octadecabacter algicola]
MIDTHAMVKALPNPVILVGPDGRVACANSPALSLLGTDATGWSYVTALRQPAILEAVEICLSGIGSPVVRYTSNDGARDTLWDVSVTPLSLEHDGGFGGFSALMSFTDTTAQSDADEKRREFVANVSHELRTPLTSLVGFIETLRGPAKDDPAAQDRFLAIMEQEAGRMHRLVEDLLSLSRVEDLERIRPTTKVVLNQLAKDIVAGLEPVAAPQNVELVVDVPDQDVEVLGDWDQLAQVLRNLVENAIKYGGENRTVTVQLTTPTEQTASLSVIDQGEGIPPHNIARLTERFYRVDSHRGRDKGGTGLGLAICKHIVTRHRARLRITSTLGQGSEFAVLFKTIGSRS